MNTLITILENPGVRTALYMGIFYGSILIAVAYLTYAERRIIGLMQLRVGPSMAGPLGILQPFADAIKLLHKETIVPTCAQPLLFFLAPALAFTLSMLAWLVIPISAHGAFATLNVGLLFILAVSATNVYSIILAGWGSQSRYAFLGSLRATAQMISYELVLGTVMLVIMVSAGSLRLDEIVLAQRHVWFVVPHFPMFIVFFLCALAETNRAPFDLCEAEAELVAGYNVEYGSMGFALFFISEYANIMLMSALGATLFWGGWLSPFGEQALRWVPGIVWLGLKTAALVFVFFWVRASVPRYRYDQLMHVCWTVLLPLTFVWFVGTATWSYWVG
ncbi:MAG: NADH-quinone oxidoreductase subunit NuoH [Alphaproteobacteria bacterium]|nr:MAG: NADH-quinone oxidoreductase subunit NuoH [Alphaproteobacteria bacterium]